MCEKERERERERVRERQRDRRQRDRETKTERQRQRQTETETERETERQKKRETFSENQVRCKLTPNLSHLEFLITKIYNSIFSAKYFSTNWRTRLYLQVLYSCV